MFEFQYQSEVMGPKGKLVRHTSKGYFASHAVLLAHLNHWDGRPGPNGGNYHYWESKEDERINRAARMLPKHHPYRIFSILHYGVQSYMNIFVSGRDREGNYVGNSVYA